MAYTKNPTWVEGGAPGITAAALNNLETQYEKAVAYVDALGVPRIQTNIDVLFRNLLKTMLRQTGLNFGVNAWSDTIEDITGLQSSSTGYYFDTANKSLKIEQSLPNMTAGNAPSPLVASASSAAAGFEAYRAFDGNNSTAWSSGTGNPAPAWIKIDCGVKRFFTNYTVYANGGGANPSSWTLEGSNTGAFAGEQTILDTRAGISAWPGPNTYPLNTQGFRYYRMNVTADNGAGTQVYVNSISFTPATTATLYWTAQLSSGTLTKSIVEALENLGTGSITYYISRDNGVTFTACTKDVITDISTQPTGTSIVLKAVITGNAELLGVAWGGEV